MDLEGYSTIEEYFSNQFYENPDAVTIKEFQTADISYEGSAFTIAPGKSDYPVRFDGEDCTHSTVLSLYMNYFGLRIPSAGEWMKAARGDNTRCWPWMDETCGVDGDTYCSTYYSCLSNDEANDCSSEVWDCQSECEDIQQDCESQWQQTAMACINECFYSQTDTGEYVYPDCYDCIDNMSEMQWAACMSGEGEGNPYEEIGNRLDRVNPYEFRKGMDYELTSIGCARLAESTSEDGLKKLINIIENQLSLSGINYKFTI